ncbi:MAG: SDR family NAD(P)-dependent oxidoreductase [Chloroflexota bacterium]
MQGRLIGQVSIVTGAGRGIGRGIAEALAEVGARVAVADTDASAAQATAEALRAGGHDALDLAVDVSNRPAVKQMVEAVLRRWGQIDILVNNAAVSDSTPALELTDEAWHRMIAVNLTGVFLCSQIVGRHMVSRGYGRIVNISSIASQFGAPGSTAYAATKAGVLGLTRVMAVEWGLYDVTVNAVCPGNIDTEFLRDALAWRAASRGLSVDQVIQTIVAKTPAGRLGMPADVAAMVLFLALPEAGFVTGQVINVCGGRSANMS